MADRDRRGLDALLDVVIYAPIGAFFHGPELVDELADRGRTQVSNARIIGKMAVSRGRSEASKVQDQVQERVSDLLVAVARAAGAPLAGAPESDDRAHGSEPESATPPSSVVDESAGSAASRLRVVPESVPDVDELAIPDYDNLSASQVVPRLESLAADELEAVRDYEQAHRGRMTILSRIAQLEAS
jgi:hypothetical protein